MSGPSRPRRLLILAICCLSLFIVGVDTTIVNVALPAIQRDLLAPVSGLQWIMDAYTLVLAGFLIAAGSAADRFGRRRVFQTGFAVFGLGSLLCSLAPSLNALIAFRIVQAVGGSMLNPVAVSIIANTFTEPRERARAIGAWGAVFGLSIALGPVLGGLLVATVGWRGIFWVNLPVCVIAIVLTALFVPESRAEHPRRFDPVGQVLVIAMLWSLTYAIIEAPREGWFSPLILRLFALAAAALAGLIWYESRRREPLLDLRLFGSAPFSGANVIAVASFAAMSGFLFLNTLYLQDVRQLSALGAGLYTLPMAAMTLIFSPLSGRIVGRRGPRIPLLVAGAGLAIGALMLTPITATTAFGWLVAAYVIFGIGFGMVNAPITTTAIAGLPRAQAGLAAGIASTSRRVGQTMGVAVVGSALAAGLGRLMPESMSQASQAGWWIITGAGVIVLLVGLLSTGRAALGSPQPGALISEKTAP